MRPLEADLCTMKGMITMKSKKCCTNIIIRLSLSLSDFFLMGRRYNTVVVLIINQGFY